MGIVFVSEWANFVRVPVILNSPSSRFQHRHSTPGLGYREPLHGGQAGTSQTIARMRELVHDAVLDSSFLRKGIEIVRSVPAFDDLGELRALYDWVRRNIRFTKDPLTVEKLTPPAELLKLRAGDCDCQSLLIASWLVGLGYPARWITLATSADSPDEWTHIYTEAEAPPGSGHWIPMDTARLDAAFGVEPPFYFRKRAWDVVSDSYQDLSGQTHFRISMGRPKFLSGYLSSGMGQDGGWSDINWTPVVQQSVAEIPSIIAATSGHGSATSPYGTYSGSSYAIPGATYGMPGAGYTAPSPYGISTGAGLSVSPMTLLIFGIALLAFMHGRNQ